MASHKAAIQVIARRWEKDAEFILQHTSTGVFTVAKLPGEFHAQVPDILARFEGENASERAAQFYRTLDDTCLCTDTFTCDACEHEWRILEASRDPYEYARGGASPGQTQFVDRKRAYRPDLTGRPSQDSQLLKLNARDMENAGQFRLRLADTNEGAVEKALRNIFVPEYSAASLEDPNRNTSMPGDRPHVAAIRVDAEVSRSLKIRELVRTNFPNALVDNLPPIVKQKSPSRNESAQKPTRTRRPKAQPAQVTRTAPDATNSRSQKDAIRRAFIAWLKGRAYFAGDHEIPRYWLKGENRGGKGKTRIAPWDSIVRSKFSSCDEFAKAAHAWQSPKNARTLEIH